MKYLRNTSIGLVVAASFGAAVQAQDAPPFVGARMLSIALADAAVSAAVAHCQEKGYQVAAALVDRSGRLQALLRDPLAGAHTIEVSRRKAYAAASLQTSTLELSDPGLQGLNFAEDMLLIGGGVPIRVGGHFYGAIGVSGAPAEKRTGDVDDRCASAGVAVVTETLEFAD
jgi:uncharacterized protein GlcG (DUF336 family)